MVFLFLAVVYSQYSIREAQKYKDLQKAANEREQQLKDLQSDIELARKDHRKITRDICNKLASKFPLEIQLKWQADINCKTLTFSFNATEGYFDTGKHDVKPDFERVLNKFIPEYFSLLYTEFSTNISEIRIEGHTSSEWGGNESVQQLSVEERYINNMDLSQKRSAAVLIYTLKVMKGLPDDSSPWKFWVLEKFNASGYSSSRLIRYNFGKEYKKRSRRVEFRIITKTEETITEILKKLQSRKTSNKSHDLTS